MFAYLTAAILQGLLHVLGVGQYDCLLEEPLLLGPTTEVAIRNEALVQLVLPDEVNDVGKVEEGSAALREYHVPDVWVLDGKFEVGVCM